MADPGSLSPPPVEAFRSWTRPCGPRAARLDLSGIAVEIESLPEALADRMSILYAPYLGPPTGQAGPLRVRMYAAPVEYFIPPAFAREREVYRMHTAYEDGVFEQRRRPQ